jgi:hypothetical protein
MASSCAVVIAAVNKIPAASIKIRNIGRYLLDK